MKVLFRIFFILCVLFFISENLQSQCQINSLDCEKKWNKIEPFFTPPDKYKGIFGNYRSPLLFYNGDIVKTSQDWDKRREEILNRWSDMLGKWPPLIENQEMTILETIKRENFIQHHIRFWWTPLEQTDAYLLIPNEKGKKPAVITVFYEPETSIGYGDKPNRDFAYQLAKRGFVTLSLGTRKATKDKTYSIFYPNIEHAQVEPLSMLACAAANAWELLSKIDDVDSTSIGIVGHSFGGKWAMFASCLFDKFACAAWSDPGIVFDESRPNVNYWEPYYLGYHSPPWRKRGIINKDNPAQGLYPKLVKEGYDLHELHALMAPRPFLVSGGSEDPPERWILLNSIIAVNQLLGFKNRVAMTNRPEHSPNAESNEQIYLFFEFFLKNKCE